MGLLIPDRYTDVCLYVEPERPIRPSGLIVARLGLIVADVNGEPTSQNNACFPDPNSPLRWYALMIAAYLAESVEYIDYHKQQAPEKGILLATPTPLSTSPTRYPNIAKKDVGPLYPIAKTIHGIRGPNHTGPVSGYPREGLCEAYVIAIQRDGKFETFYMPAVAIPKEYHEPLDHAIKTNITQGILPINMPISMVQRYHELAAYTNWHKDRVQVTDFPLLVATD